MIDAFVNIDNASHFIILKTLPGNANAIGVLIDNLDWEEIMGTICGDDTCLIICRKEKDAEELKTDLLVCSNVEEKEVNKHANGIIHTKFCYYR